MVETKHEEWRLEKRKILAYLFIKKKKAVVTWFVASVVFSSISVLIELISSLFVDYLPFRFSAPAMEGKILLGAVLMGASSLIIYYEKNEEIKDELKTNKEADVENGNRDFDFGIFVPVQILLLLLGGFAFGSLTLLIRTRTAFANKLPVDFIKLNDINVVCISYVLFAIIALISLLFKFQYLWKANDYPDFRDWDTKSGKYSRKPKSSFKDIQT